MTPFFLHCTTVFTLKTPLSAHTSPNFTLSSIPLTAPAKSDPTKSHPKSVQPDIRLKSKLLKRSNGGRKRLKTRTVHALFVNDRRRWVDDASLC